VDNWFLNVCFFAATAVNADQLQPNVFDESLTINWPLQLGSRVSGLTQG